MVPFLVKPAFRSRLALELEACVPKGRGRVRRVARRRARWRQGRSWNKWRKPPFMPRKPAGPAGWIRLAPKPCRPTAVERPPAQHASSVGGSENRARKGIERPETGSAPLRGACPGCDLTRRPGPGIPSRPHFQADHRRINTYREAPGALPGGVKAAPWGCWHRPRGARNTLQRRSPCNQTHRT